MISLTWKHETTWCPGHRMSPVQPPQWRVAGSIATISRFDVMSPCISTILFLIPRTSVLLPARWEWETHPDYRHAEQQWMLLLGATYDRKSWLEGNGACRRKCNNENKHHWGVNGSCLYKKAAVQTIFNYLPVQTVAIKSMCKCKGRPRDGERDRVCVWERVKEWKKESEWEWVIEKGRGIGRRGKEQEEGKIEWEG